MQMICVSLGQVQVLARLKAVRYDIVDHQVTGEEADHPLSYLVRIAATALEMVGKRHGISQDRN